MTLSPVNTVPLEDHNRPRHRRNVAEAVNRLIIESPQENQLAVSGSTTINSATWTAISGAPWTIGSRNPRAFLVDAHLDWQANGTVLYQLETRVLVDSVQVRDLTLQFPRAFLLTPHPTPLASGVLPVRIPLQVLAPGSHTVSIECRTSASGDFTILDSSVVSYRFLQRGLVT